MALIARVILALVFVLQSLPGLAGEACSAMAGRGMSLDVRSMAGEASANSGGVVCPCCVASEPPRPACEAGDEVVACRCELTRAERTQSPPPNQPGVRFQITLAILPSVLDLAPLNTAASRLDASHSLIAPKRLTNSIQSVLCMWTV